MNENSHCLQLSQLPGWAKDNDYRFGTSSVCASTVDGINTYGGYRCITPVAL